jgi:glycerol-3-phosphate acyltransferase PlsY
VNPFLLVLLGYLAGATPTSYWVGRAFHGVDLRTRGSGNLGATNAFRVMGWKAALPVVLVDVGKGWLPVWLFPRIDASGTMLWALAYGAAAIVGHVFSVWVRFRGGKGVATSAGVFLGLAPWSVLVGLLVFAVTVTATRIVSLGSILAALCLPFAVAYGPGAWPPGEKASLVWFTAALALFVIWAHRSNIRRLLRGEERRFGRKGEPSSEGPTGDDPHPPGEERRRT